MLDDFFTRALLAGIGVALTTGPLGCLVVWRRMAYFGDTIAHSALLGVALALILEMDLMLMVFAVATLVALLLMLLERGESLSADALLGILSHGGLAIGLVLVSLSGGVRVDLNALLFGDILAVTPGDIALVWIGGGVVLAVLAVIWRPMIAASISEDIAAAEGLKPQRARLVFMLLMALVVAISIKIVGILLVTALLIVPPASARRLSVNPEAMAVYAALAGVIAVIAGLTASLRFDTPSGPSIVVAAVVLFVVSLALPAASALESQSRSGERDG